MRVRAHTLVALALALGLVALVGASLAGPTSARFLQAAGGGGGEDDGGGLPSGLEEDDPIEPGQSLETEGEEQEDLSADGDDDTPASTQGSTLFPRCRFHSRTGTVACGTNLVPSQARNGFWWRVHALVERDANGRFVGNGHGYAGFARTGWNVTSKGEVEVGNATARFATIEAPALGDSSIAVTAMVVKREGLIMLNGDEEAYNLTARSVKFNITVRDWDFCAGGCRRAGEYLDIVFQFKGPRLEPPVEAEEPDEEEERQKGRRGRSKKRFNFGVVADMSALVDVDGAWQGVVEGFPRIVRRGRVGFVVVRVPKFDSYATYDPVVDVDTAEEPSVCDGVTGGWPNCQIIGVAAGVGTVLLLGLAFLGLRSRSSRVAQ